MMNIESINLLVYRKWMKWKEMVITSWMIQIIRRWIKLSCKWTIEQVRIHEELRWWMILECTKINQSTIDLLWDTRFTLRCHQEKISMSTVRENADEVHLLVMILIGLVRTMWEIPFSIRDFWRPIRNHFLKRFHLIFRLFHSRIKIRNIEEYTMKMIRIEWSKIRIMRVTTY